MATAIGLKIGDSITVLVLGVDVHALIPALRKIDWGGVGLNFAIVFTPGYIEKAPHGLLVSVYVSPARDGAIMRVASTALPSATLIRAGDVIGQISTELGQAVAIPAAVTVVAASQDWLARYWHPAATDAAKQ
ncbi:hypothetical protein [Sphingomonas sp. GB1N7]|uniref:hypothetical protein n=1 Tax=Parasphingomonas caseinilytica TaxID=3096158 RepID=UPI002FC6585D